MPITVTIHGNEVCISGVSGEVWIARESQESAIKTRDLLEDIIASECEKAHAPATPAMGNYVCDDEVYPQEATFDNGRVVKIDVRYDGKPFLSISPKSEYPKPCGICDGVIQSKDDLDWHGYGNCRDIPEAIMNKPLAEAAPSADGWISGWLAGRDAAIKFCWSRRGHRTVAVAMKKLLPYPPAGKGGDRE